MSDNNNSNDKSPETNPFIRFKQHVDANVGAGLQSIFSVPIFVSRSLQPPQPMTIANANNLNDGTSSQFSRRRAEDYEDDGDGFFGALETPKIVGGGSGSGSGSASGTGSGSGGGFSPSNQDPDAARIEALLNSLSGGLWEEHRFAWDLFASRSPYSPLALDEQGVRPPRPNGLPAHMSQPYHRGKRFPRASSDDNVFLWTDAFEDLLAESSGLPMKSLEYELRVRQTFGDDSWGHLRRRRAERCIGGRPKPFPARRTAAESWVRHVFQQDLNEAYFPVDDRQRGIISPRTMAEWAARRQEESKLCQAVRPFGLSMPPPQAQGEIASSEEVQRRLQEMADKAWGVEKQDQKLSDEERKQKYKDRLGKVVDSWWDVFHPNPDEKKTPAGMDEKGVLDKPFAGFEWPLSPEDMTKHFEKWKQIREKWWEELPEERKEEVNKYHEAFEKLSKQQEAELTRLGKAADQEAIDKSKDSSKQPDSEQDLFTAIASAYHEAESTVKPFVKSMFDGLDMDGKWHMRTSSTKSVNERTTSKEVVRDGSGKTVRTVENYVDEDGNRHIKTDIRKTDSWGKEISHESTYTVQPKGQKKPVVVEEVKEPEKVESKVENEKKWTKEDDSKGNKSGGGWFW